MAPLSLLLASVLVACGTNLPQDEYVAKAERACRSAAESAKGLPSLSASQPPSLAGAAVAHKVVLHGLEKDLAKIVPPRDLASEYGEVLIEVSDAIERLEEVKDDAEARDISAARKEIRGLEDIGRKAAERAKKAELPACAAVMEEVIG